MARARSLRLAHAWRLILAGVLLAVIVVGLELALLVWLRFDPFQVTPTPSTGVDDHTADEVFLGFMRLELLLLASAGLSVSLPWLIARRRLGRQLRERPEAERIGDDELSRLPAEVQAFVRETRILRAAIEHPLSRWAGLSIMDGTPLERDSELARELVELGRGWLLALAALSEPDRRRLDVQPTSDLLAHAQLRARGQPSELDLARTSDAVLSALDAVEAAVVASR